MTISETNKKDETASEEILGVKVILGLRENSTTAVRLFITLSLQVHLDLNTLLWQFWSAEGAEAIRKTLFSKGSPSNSRDCNKLDGDHL